MEEILFFDRNSKLSSDPCGTPKISIKLEEKINCDSIDISPKREKILNKK